MLKWLLGYLCFDAVHAQLHMHIVYITTKFVLLVFLLFLEACLT